MGSGASGTCAFFERSFTFVGETLAAVRVADVVVERIDGRRTVTVTEGSQRDLPAQLRGQRLIQLYDLLAQIQQKAFDVLSDDDALPLNSLLAAISRFSLQTSARNQWFGTITARDHDDVQQHVDVLLADGKTRLKVAITAQSGARLGLDEGKEVLILLKAPWVGITQDEAVAQNADNQLPGIISHIERGAEQCEVLMALPDGQTLCATVPVNEATSLQQGQNVTAYFNADSVIIATLC